MHALHSPPSSRLALKVALTKLPFGPKEYPRQAPEMFSGLAWLTVQFSREHVPCINEMNPAETVGIRHVCSKSASWRCWRKRSFARAWEESFFQKSQCAILLRLLKMARRDFPDSFVGSTQNSILVHVWWLKHN